VEVPVGVKEQLMSDLQEAMKARDADRVSAIRMLRAAIERMEMDRTDPKDPHHGEPIEETDRVGAVQREVKQRRESLEFAQKAARADLVAKEEQALAIMERYLPRELSREEIAAEVEPLIAELGKDFRKVMPVASQKLRGRANGRVVSEVVRELTEGQAQK
jgi:uncharacterized protein